MYASLSKTLNHWGVYICLKIWDLTQSIILRNRSTDLKDSCDLRCRVRCQIDKTDSTSVSEETS